jgi:hypothetical protein
MERRNTFIYDSDGRSCIVTGLAMLCKRGSRSSTMQPSLKVLNDANFIFIYSLWVVFPLARASYLLGLLLGQERILTVFVYWSCPCWRRHHACPRLVLRRLLVMNRTVGSLSFDACLASKNGCFEMGNLLQKQPSQLSVARLLQLVCAQWMEYSHTGMRFLLECISDVCACCTCSSRRSIIGKPSHFQYFRKDIAGAKELEKHSHNYRIVWLPVPRT